MKQINGWIQYSVFSFFGDKVFSPCSPVWPELRILLLQFLGNSPPHIPFLSPTRESSDFVNQEQGVPVVPTARLLPSCHAVFSHFTRPTYGLNTFKHGLQHQDKAVPENLKRTDIHKVTIPKQSLYFINKPPVWHQLQSHPLRACTNACLPHLCRSQQKSLLSAFLMGGGGEIQKERRKEGRSNQLANWTEASYCAFSTDGHYSLFIVRPHRNPQLVNFLI